MTASSKPIHLLIIDDDAMSRDLLSVLLEGEGYAVECAASGEAALALLGSNEETPEVVLTDVQMPGISGPPLADRLRQACSPGTLLLAMSGSGPSKEAISHFDGFLLKPFTMQEITSVISARGNTRASRAATISAQVAASQPASASKSGMNDRAQEVHEVEAAKDRSPALDERIYRQLTQAMPGQQLHQMYAMCMKDARDRIASMRGMVTEHDAVQFIRQAHAIKGGCGMLGATEIYALAARLEASGLDTAGLEGTPDVNPLDELTAACDRLERILGSRV